MKVRTVSTWCVVLFSLLLPGTDLHAQGGRFAGPNLRTTSYLGLGYVASVPITPLGFSLLAVTPKLFRGAGVYADVKLTTSSPGSDPYYLPGVSVSDAELTYGDLLYEQKSDWLTIDLAMVYAITGEFALYAGAGYSKEKHFRQYFDDTQSRGDLGFYWIAAPAESGTRVNVLGGALIRLRRFLYFQLGVESAPRAVNLGLTVTVAR
jgi:hypothetical protein